VWPLKPVHDLVQLAQSQVCSVVMAATVMGSSMALTSDSAMATDSEGVVIYVVVAGVVVADVVGVLMQVQPATLWETSRQATIEDWMGRTIDGGDPIVVI
jgi:hypothetical protein